MKVGIMQPYLFPYIGYFQLINAVDLFVVHDDVQYIKGGWINRNRIQINDEEHLFTFSLKKDSSLKPINTRLFSDLFPKQRHHFLKLLENNYKRAPNFSESYEVLSHIFTNDEMYVAPFITQSLKQICQYLQIETPLLIASELDKDNRLKNQPRVIDICKRLKADTYINPVGGEKLYSRNEFKKNNISLFFLKTKEEDIRKEAVRTSQRSYIPNLSVIDLMMFHSPNDMRQLLKYYSLHETK